MRKIILLISGLMLLTGGIQGISLAERISNPTNQRGAGMTAEQKANQQIFGMCVTQQPMHNTNKLKICQKSYIYRLAK